MGSRPSNRPPQGSIPISAILRSFSRLAASTAAPPPSRLSSSCVFRALCEPRASGESFLGRSASLIGSLRCYLTCSQSAEAPRRRSRRRPNGAQAGQSGVACAILTHPAGIPGGAGSPCGHNLGKMRRLYGPRHRTIHGPGIVVEPHGPSMATWQHGNMATGNWQHGNMATWQAGKQASRREITSYRAASLEGPKPQKAAPQISPCSGPPGAPNSSTRRVTSGSSTRGGAWWGLVRASITSEPKQPQCLSAKKASIP